MDDLRGDGADQQAGEPAGPARAHDEQVGTAHKVIHLADRPVLIIR